jgi:hypothetical protein
MGSDVKTGWQPIDTAPKDGTRVLVYGQRGDVIDIGSWRGCGRYRPRTKQRSAYFEKAWGADGSHIFSPQPTHWMPLPDAPKTSGRT